MQTYLDVSELYALDTGRLDAEQWEALWRWLGRVFIKANRNKEFHKRWLEGVEPKRLPHDVLSLMAAIRDDIEMSEDSLPDALRDALDGATPALDAPIRIGNDKFMLHSQIYEKWGFLI